MNDWRQMEAGRELDWLIAQKQGFKAIPSTINNRESYYLQLPDGRTWGWKPGTEIHRYEPVDFATWDSHHDAIIPHYSKSAEASHRLMDGVYYEVCNQNGESDQGEYRLETFGDYGCIVYADTLAMVFCCAYLMRQERIEATHE